MVPQATRACFLIPAGAVAFDWNDSKSERGGEVSSVHHRAGKDEDAQAEPRQAEQLPVEYPTAMAAPVNSEALSRSTALKFETEHCDWRAHDEGGEGVSPTKKRRSLRFRRRGWEVCELSRNPPRHMTSLCIPFKPSPRPRRARKGARSRSSTHCIGNSGPSVRCVHRLTHCLERRGRVQDLVLGFVKYHSHDSLLPLRLHASPTSLSLSCEKPKLSLSSLSLSILVGKGWGLHRR